MTGAERLIAEGEANALLKQLRAKFPGGVDANVEARVRAADASTLGT